LFLILFTNTINFWHKVN